MALMILARSGELFRIVAAVPDEWLDGRDRAGYVEYLARRLEAPRAFTAEAEEARRAG